MLDILLAIFLYWFNYKVKENYALFKHENVYRYLCDHGYGIVLNTIWTITRYVDAFVCLYIPIKIAIIVIGVIL